VRRAACVALLVLAACVPDPGPTMNPGEDCLTCHDGSGAPRWTAAGTVYRTIDANPDDGVAGVSIHLTDASGRTITLRSNEAGNFYTRERLTFPIGAAIEQDGVRQEMPHIVEYGGCNRCHAQPPQEDAPGRISLTGHDHEAE
jgi:hypothetical protein